MMFFDVLYTTQFWLKFLEKVRAHSKIVGRKTFEH